MAMINKNAEVIDIEVIKPECMEIAKGATIVVEMIEENQRRMMGVPDTIWGYLKGVRQ